MQNSNDFNQSDLKLQISFPKSDQDHRLQLVNINESIFAILHSPLESNGPINLYCEDWSLVLLAPIKSKTDLLKIHLSDTEKEELEKAIGEKFYFRNGIDITEQKHTSFEFRVYYITGLSSLYLDFIEKKWREDFGLPKLCSYSSGR